MLSFAVTFLSLLVSTAANRAYPPQVRRAVQQTGSQPRFQASFALNGSYVDPRFGQSLSNINADAIATINALINSGQFPGGWVGQNGYTAISEWDYEHGTTEFESAVSQGDNMWCSSPGGTYAAYHVACCDSYNDDCGWSALGQLEAHKAYGGNTYITRAVDIWEFVTKHGFIFQSDLDAGYLVNTKLASVTLQPMCNGQSMLSGVYWMNGDPNDVSLGGATDPDVNAVSSGLYALLGAQLCGMTGNQTYCEIAYQTMGWIDRLLVNEDGLIEDHVNGSSCVVSTGELFTYNTGLYIAAYATLYNVTRNTTALALAERTAQAAMTTAKWNTQKGVIFEGALANESTNNDVVGFKAILMRYLHLAYPYVSSDIQSAILQYFNIQYWSMANYDSNSPDKPVYFGANWTGPGYGTFTGQSLVTAIDVLNGLQLNPPSAFPSTTATDVPVATAS